MVVMQWKSDVAQGHIQKFMLFFIVEMLKQEMNRSPVLY
jgi:hypothetical protein